MENLHVLGELINELMLMRTLDDIHKHNTDCFDVYTMIWRDFMMFLGWFLWHPIKKTQKTNNNNNKSFFNEKRFGKSITWHNYEILIKTDFMPDKLRETWGHRKTATHSTNMIINVHERLRWVCVWNLHNNQVEYFKTWERIS